MRDGARRRWRALVARVRRIERREVREFLAWLETTRNLVHVSALLLVPLVIGLVTAISNAVAVLSFLLFPPLASGTYTLFSEPEGRYASPWTFVGGYTVGAVCGYTALQFGRTVYTVNPGDVHAVSAAVAVFMTGAATWAVGAELPSAFSTALLTLVAEPAADATLNLPVVSASGGFALAYVLSIVAASSLVAGVFLVWREQFYEHRAEYIYQSTKGDDHVLVPTRGDHPDATAMLGGRLAAAHEAGKVVLLDVVGEADVAAAERALVGDRAAGDATPDSVPDGGRAADVAADETIPEAIADAIDDDESLEGRATERAAAECAVELERRARRIETEVGVPCEVMVAVGDGDRPATVVQAARDANCDLVAVPYEEHRGRLSPFVRELFRGDVDVLVHRSVGDRSRWKDVLVPVRRASDVAHAMLDFARRLTGSTGRVSVCHCLGGSGDLRRAESMLADLVETFSGNFETRVSRATIERFLRKNAAQYDLVIIGASTDRSEASRFVSPPTFERIRDCDCDVAILDRNFRY